MMNAIEKFNITAHSVSESGNEAIFVAEPLVRGYGITLGNLGCGNIKLLYCVHHFSFPPV